MKAMINGKIAERRYRDLIIASLTGFNKWRKYLHILILLLPLSLLFIDIYKKMGMLAQKYNSPSDGEIYDLSGDEHCRGRKKEGVRSDYVFQENQNISLVSRWTAGPCNVISIGGNYLYINNGGFLDIPDIPKPGQPKLTGRLTVPTSPVRESSYFMNGYGANAVFIHGSHLYDAAGFHGLYIWNVSDPVLPHELGLLDTDGYDALYILQNDLITSIPHLFTSDTHQTYMLHDNSPNPLYSSTNIRYGIQSTRQASVRVYNVPGRLVTTLVEKDQSDGTYIIRFDAVTLPAVRISAG